MPDQPGSRVRTLLFTGKGGVGKTTLAAGTAALSALAGHRTLVLSTDAAHSLGDAFGTPIGSEPTRIEENLHVQQVDVQERFERSWAEVQRYLMTVLDSAGVDPITAEELTVLPGAEEILALLEVRLQVLSGQWDVVVVDCAPTAETLRLLALPEALGWYLNRVFPAERRVVKALRPVLSRAAGVPMPGNTVFDALERLHSDLEEVRTLLTGETAGIRLVLTPESVVVAEARRLLTSLSLFGYRVDGVVANRIFPVEESDEWRRGWVEAQTAVLADVESSFAGVPLWRSPYWSAEPVGLEALAGFAQQTYGEQDPLALPGGAGPLSLRRTANGTTLRLALPFVEKSDIGLARHADELVVTVGSYRRVLTLPAALVHQEIVGAKIEDGELRVRFHAAGEGEAAASSRRAEQ